MRVCLRYTKSQADAEDVFQEAFIKVFHVLGQYNGRGSLEGWLRRIFVTTAINHYHKYKTNNKQPSLDDVPDQAHGDPDVIDQMSATELENIINTLPEGYRLVFNLYAIEGYSHKEISEQLGIAEGTSKSQLAKARNWLKKNLQHQFLTYELDRQKLG